MFEFDWGFYSLYVYILYIRDVSCQMHILKYRNYQNDLYSDESDDIGLHSH